MLVCFVCFGSFFFTWMALCVVHIFAAQQKALNGKQPQRLKGLRCRAYLTYPTNSCVRSGGSTQRSPDLLPRALFICGLSEWGVRLQAGQWSALCSRTHCLSLSRWLYPPHNTNCQEGTVPTAHWHQAARLANCLHTFFYTWQLRQAKDTQTCRGVDVNKLTTARLQPHSVILT